MPVSNLHWSTPNSSTLLQGSVLKAQLWRCRWTKILAGELLAGANTNLKNVKYSLSRLVSSAGSTQIWLCSVVPYVNPSKAFVWCCKWLTTMSVSSQLASSWYHSFLSCHLYECAIASLDTLILSICNITAIQPPKPHPSYKDKAFAVRSVKWKKTHCLLVLQDYTNRLFDRFSLWDQRLI